MAVTKKKSLLRLKDPGAVITQQHATVRGLKTAWLEAGSKYADNLFLFLHGFPDDAFVWSEQIRHFREKFLVVAPMMRGVGQSVAASDQKRYGLSAISLDNLNILRHIDPKAKKNIYLAGHDLGSLHAWHLAALLGKRLKGLVILNGGHPLQAWERRKNLRQILKSWYIYLFLLPFIPEAILKTFGKPLLKRLQSKNGMPPEKLKQAELALSFTPNSVKQYREIVKSLPDYISKANRFKLNVPILSISSLHDAFVEPASLKELHLVAHKPTVRVIEGRHWIQCEAPTRVNHLIEKFFRDECGWKG